MLPDRLVHSVGLTPAPPVGRPLGGCRFPCRLSTPEPAHPAVSPRFSNRFHYLGSKARLSFPRPQVVPGDGLDDHHDTEDCALRSRLDHRPRPRRWPATRRTSPLARTPSRPQAKSGSDSGGIRGSVTRAPAPAPPPRGARLAAWRSSPRPALGEVQAENFHLLLSRDHESSTLLCRGQGSGCGRAAARACGGFPAIGRSSGAQTDRRTRRRCSTSSSGVGWGWRLPRAFAVDHEVIGRQSSGGSLKSRWMRLVVGQRGGGGFGPGAVGAPVPATRTTSDNAAELGRIMCREGRHFGPGQAAGRIVLSTGSNRTLKKSILGLFRPRRAIRSALRREFRFIGREVLQR
jgi:hypothetical protein